MHKFSEEQLVPLIIACAVIKLSKHFQRCRSENSFLSYTFYLTLHFEECADIRYLSSSCTNSDLTDAVARPAETGGIFFLLSFHVTYHVVSRWFTPIPGEGFPQCEMHAVIVASEAFKLKVSSKLKRAYVTHWADHWGTGDRRKPNGSLCRLLLFQLNSSGTPFEINCYRFIYGWSNISLVGFFYSTKGSEKKHSLRENSLSPHLRTCEIKSVKWGYHLFVI